jgi:hypothetical protein
MNFITDKAAMEKPLVDVGYDTKKLPRKEAILNRRMDHLSLPQLDLDTWTI